MCVGDFESLVDRVVAVVRGIGIRCRLSSMVQLAQCEQFLGERDRNRRDQTFTATSGDRPSPSFLSPTAPGSRRMSPSNYERLPQEGEGSGDVLFDERASAHSGPVRPPTYYGEGPFDPPSSEDEDEDESFLLKETTRSLGMVENAGYAEPDVKVRPQLSPLLRSCPQLSLPVAYSNALRH